MTTFVSSGAFQSQSVNEIISLAEAFGINHIELASGCRYSDDMLREVRTERARPNTYLVHNYFPPPKNPFVLNLASTNDEQRAASLTHARAAIDLCVELDCPFFSVHSGFAVDLTPEMLGKPQMQAELEPVAYDLAMEIFKSVVAELANYAAERGKDLLLENNVVAPRALKKSGDSPMLMVRPDEIADFFVDLRLPNLGLLLDVGHANVSATSYGFDRMAFVEKVLPFVGAFHLSGNNGQEDQNHMFGENEWFTPFLHEHQDKPMVIEVYNLTCDEIWRQIEITQELVTN